MKEFYLENKYKNKNENNLTLLKLLLSLEKY